MTPGFPIVACPRCDRDVLVSRDISPDGELSSRCLHCDGVVEGRPRFVDADSLFELGYHVEGRRHPHEERGCRDGGCGVQQPNN